MKGLILIALIILNVFALVLVTIYPMLEGVIIGSSEKIESMDSMDITVDSAPAEKVKSEFWGIMGSLWVLSNFIGIFALMRGD